MSFFIPFLPSLSNCSNLYHHRISTWTSCKWNHLVCSFFFDIASYYRKHIKNLAPNVDCIHNSFFYCGVVFHCATYHNLLIHSSADGAMDCSQLLANCYLISGLLNSSSFWLYQLCIYSLIYYIYTYHYPLTNISMQNIHLGWDYFVCECGHMFIILIIFDNFNILMLIY